MTQYSMDWESAGRLLTETIVAAAIVFGAIATVMRPIFDVLVHSCLDRNKAKLKELIDVLYDDVLADRLTAAKDARHALVISEANSDTLRAFQVSLEGYAVEIRQLPLISEALNRNAAAFEKVLETLSRMQAKLSEHGEELSAISALMKMQSAIWTGPDRRGRGRRLKDTDT